MMSCCRSATLTVSLALTMATAGPAAAQQAACAEQLLESMRSVYGIPALAVAVTRTDTVVFNVARGAAHLEFGVPATPSTLFQLSSTTRLFTAVLVMRLAQKGLVELDEPVTSYLADAPPAWNRVTLRHLLSNTSGLPELGSVVADAAQRQSARSLLADLYRRAPEPEPDTRWGYNIADYMVVQQIVERAGGASLSDLMRQLVFEPAGMATARYWSSNRHVVVGAATGYYPDSTVTPRRYVHRAFDFPEHLFGAGGAAASLEDMIRFDRALRDARLLADGVRETMWSDTRLLGGRTVSYGLGWDTKTHAPGHRSAGHSGGFLTTFRTYPGSNITVVVLTNGFLQPVNTDDLATAFAAVWDPAIIGFSTAACDVAGLANARF
jgi:D-alanyl-D-alanine carboxypeptidase